jgi:adenylylsulfate kinase
MYKDSHLRSVAKAFSWRISGTIATAVIVFFFTGLWQLAVVVSFVEFFSKIALFFFHERIWDLFSLGKQERKPVVLWFTGLSGAGKSTIADKVFHELKKKRLRVERLDGDTIRDIFPATGFSRQDREEHIKRVGYLASRLEKNGVFVVSSFISPYRESREFVRGLCGNFLEVHVATPLEVCEQRDVKGLYAKARKGEILNFTGLDAPYEAPESPEIKIDTSTTSLEEAASIVVSRALQKNI